MGSEIVDIGSLLTAWRAGDTTARDKLIGLFYPDLRRAAAAMLRDESNVSLSSGDLVHEVMLKLVAQQMLSINDRAHFLALASRMMRNALIDHVRAKHTNKRSHHRVELMTNIPDAGRLDVEDLVAALDRLARIDPERADIVEMRYFGGMAISDIATVLAVSESTVKRRWEAARLWLFQALEQTTT